MSEPAESTQDDPRQSAAEDEQAIPMFSWVHQQLQEMKKAGHSLNACAAERLLGLGPGQVTELRDLREALDVHEALGCGECATIYRATRRSDGQVLALKVMEFGSQPTETAEATVMAMARNEIKALRALPRSSNVVELLGLWCTPKQLAMGRTAPWLAAQMTGEDDADADADADADEGIASAEGSATSEPQARCR